MRSNRFRKAQAALGALPPYPAAAIAALGLGALVDVAVLPGPRSLEFYVFLVGLMLGLGAALGGLWKLALHGIGQLPRSLHAPILSVFSLGPGLHLADTLGGFARLGGPYHWYAVFVLASSGIGALVLAAGIWLCVPHAGAPAGRMWAWPERRRWRSATLLVVAAVGLSVADRLVYVGLYPQAHMALRVSSLACLMLAFGLVHERLRLPRLRGSRLAVIGGWLVIPLVMLDARQLLALHAFSVRPYPALVLEVSRRILDLDRDGYSALLGGGDCDDLNPAVHPGAREIPGNLIDDNCVLGDAVERIVDIEQLPIPEGDAPIDVVLITVDSLRPDHMGVYNPAYGPQGRHTTPSIDQWSQKATIFRRAYTAGGWTSIAVPTMMRGVYARRLTWTRYYETNRYALVRAPHHRKLDKSERVIQLFPLAAQEPQPTLAEQLERRGMHTVAIVDDGFSSMLQRGVGMDRGFTVYRKVEELENRRHDDRAAVDMALQEIRRVPRGKRFFLWLHLFGPHSPNRKHPGVPTYGDSMIDGYDHEVRYMDEQLGRLLRSLEHRRDDVAVFVASDHGESFQRLTRRHGFSLDEEVIRVPLLARVPGWPAHSISTLASLIDLTPTILSLTETPVPQGLDGLDLAPIVQDPSRAPERVLISDSWRFLADGTRVLDITAAYDGQRKVVFDPLRHNLMLYHPGQPQRPPRRIDPLARNPLTRHLLGYLEETGGRLKLID